MNDKRRMLEGKLYNPYEVDDGDWERSRPVLAFFNAEPFEYERDRMEVLKPILGHLGKNCSIHPPFYCDKGKQIFIGDYFYANVGLTILDEGKVEIGDHVFLGPHVSIYTPVHPIDAEIRNTGLEYTKPVVIKDDVWIGGNVVINPGVTIGSNVVIGSGSVVTKDIPDNVIAAGNPCRVIRAITEEDHAYWKQQADEYYSQIG